MSYFASAITFCLEELGITQLSLAQRAGVEPANLNRYVKGRMAAGPDFLEKVCSAVPPEYRFRLIFAYLQDRLPPVLAKEVSIQPVKPKSGKSGLPEVSETREKLPAKVEEALVFLRNECRHNTAFVDWIVSTVRILKDE